MTTAVGDELRGPPLEGGDNFNKIILQFNYIKEKLEKLIKLIKINL
jgi:hypothetical protein